MAIEGSLMELSKFFTVWVITMLGIYMPHFWRDKKRNTKVILNLIHITLLLPVLINAIARGTRFFDVIAVDWAFLFTTLAVTFLFMLSVVQSSEVKDWVSDFDRDSASTGKTLGLSLVGLMIGLFVSRKAYDGAMYRHAYAP